MPLHPSWKTEFWGLWVALRTDPWIVLLFPMFFASNWFYTWREYGSPSPLTACQLFFPVVCSLSAIEFNDFNGAIFNIRARSLNNLVYWLAQIIGSVCIGFLLDQQGINRRLRAFTAWCILLIMVLIVHVWAYFYQRYAWFFCLYALLTYCTSFSQRLHSRNCHITDLPQN